MNGAIRSTNGLSIQTIVKVKQTITSQWLAQTGFNASGFPAIPLTFSEKPINNPSGFPQFLIEVRRWMLAVRVKTLRWNNWDAAARRSCGCQHSNQESVRLGGNTVEQNR